MKFLTLFLIISLIHQGWPTETKENKTFVATDDWQEIPDGQSVPAGLHVRINLQTGKKEAKILVKNENLVEGQQQQEPKVSNAKDVALTVVAESFGIKDEKNEKSEEKKHVNEAFQRIGVDYTLDEKIENIKRDYRSYEELKKSFEGTRKSLKTNAEVIVQLIDEFHNITTASDNMDSETRVKTQIQILESINYLMYQFDNALLFVDKGGLEQVLLPVLVNQTNIDLKVEAMRVLGAMSQNNPRVQIKVFDRNVGSHLTQILMTSTKTQELSAALYAFSSLLRAFPHAQQRILSTSGTQALISILARKCELKIKAKAATIISDIIIERDLVLKASPPEDPLAAAQYSEIHFPKWLMDNAYCETMDSLMVDYMYGFLEAPDILEYFINSLESTRTLCSSFWVNSPKLMDSLLTLRNHYNQKKDEYPLLISVLLQQFLKKVYGDEINGEYISHDEL